MPYPIRETRGLILGFKTISCLKFWTQTMGVKGIGLPLEKNIKTRRMKFNV